MSATALAIPAGVEREDPSLEIGLCSRIGYGMQKSFVGCCDFEKRREEVLPQLNCVVARGLSVWNAIVVLAAVADSALCDIRVIGNGGKAIG